MEHPPEPEGARDPRVDLRHIEPAPPERGGWIRRLAPFLAAHRRNVILAFGMAIVGMALTALTPVFEKVIIDDVIVQHRRPLWPWLTLLVLAGAIGFVAAYIRRYVGGRVSLDVQYDLRNAIFERLQRLDFARHDDLQTGQLVSRASSDLALIQGLLSFLPIMSGNLVMLLLALAIMFVLSPPLTLVVLLAVPALLVLALKLRRALFPANYDAQQRAAEVAGVVDEAVTGVRVVKGFGQEDREVAHLAGTAEDLYRSRVRTVRLQARYSPALQAVPVLGQVAVLAVGGWLALHGHITLGTFLAFSSYLVQLVAPARMLAGLLSVGQQARAGAERILEVLDSNPLVAERPGASELPPVAGDVCLDDVWFGYLRSEPVLQGFSLRVRPGETVALVGASGSGKSTVSLLLPRFYDVQRGAVRLDGMDVRDVTLASLRRQIGVVFEESFLFSDTVRANIAYGHPDATRDEVVAAARAAGAHDFILELPGGYDALVGERGLTLSGGQRQRIALARAILTSPQVLILDDATSSVDSRTEEQIHATLRELMVGRTTLMVAHRRSTLRLADRIVVVDRGRVSDEGTHEELFSRSAVYRRLLAGPEDSCEGDEAVPLEAEESVAEALLDDEEERVDGAGVTPAAWAGAASTGEPDGGGNGSAARPRRLVDTAPVGMGRMGGGGRGLGGGTGAGAAALLSPTPELDAAVAALPPADDDPQVDLAREAREDDRFALRRFLRPYRWPLAFGFALVVLDTLLTLAGPFLVRQGLSSGVERGSEAALFGISLVFLAVALVDWAVTWSYTRYTGRTAERLLLALRVRIFAHLQRLSLDYYDREMAGRVMTRMTTDVEALSQLLQTGLINALVSVFSFFGVMIVLFVLDWPLMLATVTVVPPLLGATWWFRRRSNLAYGRAREHIATVNADFQENISGIRVSQAFVREERNVDSFRAVASRYLRSRLDAQRLVAIYFPFVLFLSAIADVIVLGVGSRLVAGGTLTAASVIAFLLYLDQFFSPIQQLSQVFDTWQQARASMAKINELMQTPTGTPPSEHPVMPGRVEGDIRLEHVRFTYPGAIHEALRRVDLHVAPRETVALVGETGAGKSTLVKLVARFYDPTGGRVLVDGVPVSDLDLGGYRRQLGYVPQEPFLFSGTVRDNIAYGRPSATDAEVEQAARAVGAHDFVASLPGGYLHPVSERGRSLSSGQRQLLCLARALLVDPAILVLDEATANLDLATEARVQRAMGLLAAGRTTLLIAHRLQTARAAGRIVVLAEGGVAEQGSHDDLLARGGLYASMWRSFEVEARSAS